MKTMVASHRSKGRGAGQTVGKAIVKVLDSAINMALLCIFLLFLLYGSFVLLQTGDVYNAAGTEKYAMYKPMSEDDGEGFVSLREINEDVFAWLTVYGTNIDYPVAHTDNNETYVNTDIYGQYSISGSLFLDYRNAPDFSGFSSIIYGHHMDKEVMFGGLEKFQEPEYLQSHTYGNLYYGGKDYGVEFFAFLEADAYDGSVYRPVIPAGQEESYAEHLIQNSVHFRDIDITAEDRIVLLSTCTSDTTNGRHILVGKLTDTVFTDSYRTGANSGASGQKTVDLQTAVLFGLPLWMLLPPCILVVLIVIYFLCRGAGKEKYVPRYRKTK